MTGKIDKKGKSSKRTAQRRASLGELAILSLRLGTTAFGGPAAHIAMMEDEVIRRRRWLSREKFLDLLGATNLIPSPKGAAVATLGIFLPAFVFVAISGPLVPRIRRSPMARAFLDGVNVASLALMIVVKFELGRSALIDTVTVVLALASALLLIRYQVNSAWLILGGAVIGFLVSQAGI